MTSVLLIGAGPSVWNKLDLARKFKGDKITNTAFAMTLIEQGINPNYICQYETHKGLNLEDYTKELAETNIPIVYNIQCEKEFLRFLSQNNFKTIPFHSVYHHNINNVGLFSAYFAREHLKATKIYLIGFDHCGMDYHARTYVQWVENFKKFVDSEREHCEIINCSGTGKLYMDGITDGGKWNFIE